MAECQFYDERQLQRFQDLYYRDIPNLDEKANYLVSELEALKKMDVDFIHEGEVVAEKFGAEVGKLLVEVTYDSEKIRSLEKENAEDKTNFEVNLREKEDTITRMVES